MTKQLFNFNVDVMQVLIWQYNDAEKLQSIIQNKQNWLDENVRDFWQNWYNDVFDLDTANDFGLQVWAAILGMQFVLKEDIPTLIFGFNPNAQNFNNGVFLPSGELALSTEQKRMLLKLRYRQITSNATIDEIHRAVSQILPTAGVIDAFDMSVLLTYPTIPDSQILYILDNYDVIPRPAGVKIKRRFGYASWFAFSGQGGQNFNNSTFGA